MPPKKVERTPLMEPFETGATEALYADQKIGDEDALKVAEALKTNTTVTLLDLTGQQRALVTAMRQQPST